MTVLSEHIVCFSHFCFKNEITCMIHIYLSFSLSILTRDTILEMHKINFLSCI